MTRAICSASPATDRGGVVDTMEKQIIGRGLLAGALAVFAFVFARIFVKPVIERAIDTRTARAAREALRAHGGHEHGAEGRRVHRGVQANIGIPRGAGLQRRHGCAVRGGVRGGLRTRRQRLGALAVAVCGRWNVAELYVVPALKYPPNPPAVSLDETIRQRTLLYLLMVVLSAALLAAAVYLGRRLAERLGAWNATLVAAGAYVVAAAVVMLILPTIDETPGPLLDDAGTLSTKLPRRRSL